MRVLSLLLALPLLCGATLAAPLLPPSFAGWQQQVSAKNTADPAAIDAANPAVLKEYGFNAGETAEYTRDGRKLNIRAARFNDASGAAGFCIDMT